MIRVLLAILALAYPILVYVGLLHFPVQWVATVLCCLLVARLTLLLFASRHQPGSAARALWPSLGLASACALLSAILNHAGALKLIPVVINLSCLIGFASTLRHPPSMIERFARLQEPDLDATAIAYTRRVTQVWCGFFVLNGSIALYTALACSLSTWTLYNGLIAYLLMGLLFAGEYAVRLRVKASAARTG